MTIFLIENKYRRSQIFEETFLLANFRIDVILKILFFTLNNIKIYLYDRNLDGDYTLLLRPFQLPDNLELIEKKEFVAMTLDKKNETFVIYVAFFSSDSGVYLFCRAQIVLLKVNKTLILILIKYVNFAGVFSLDLAIELLWYTEINNHIINLIKA